MKTLLTVACLLGQAAAGRIEGTVTDAANRPAPNVRIQLENPATGEETTATTDAQGRFHFDNLPAGHYRLQKHELDVSGNSPVVVTLTLSSTPRTDSILSAQAATVDLNTAPIRHNFNTPYVQFLPEANFISRNGATTGAYNLSLTSEAVVSGGTARSPAVAGQLPTGNNFRVDGADNNHKAYPGPLVYVPNEATISSALFHDQSAPVFGHSAGGDFDTVVRRGAGGLHGAIYDYLQNAHLDALDPPAARQGFNSRPRYDQNRFGASLGLPILQRKIFFFGNFEYIPLGFDRFSTGVSYAPTANGFTALSRIPGISRANLSVLESAVGDVGAAAGTMDVNGAPVPVGMVSTRVKGWQNQFVGTGALDVNAGTGDQLHFRYAQNYIHSNDGGAALAAFETPDSAIALLGSLAEHHSFGGGVLNELRLAYNRWDQSYAGGNNIFPGLSTFPNIQVGGLANLSLGPNPEIPQSSIYDTYQVSDALELSTHGHNLALGFDGLRYISSHSGLARFRGTYLYSGLARFLLDLPPDVLAQRSFGSSALNDNRYLLEGFVEDTRAVRSGLSLSLGLRYQYDTVPAALRQQSLNSIADVPTVVRFGEPRAETHLFAPHAGVAWAPGSKSTTVFRAGFGIHYDALYNSQLPYGPFAPQLGSTITMARVVNVPGFLRTGGLLPPVPPGAHVNVMQARALTTSFVQDQKLPYSVQWSAAVQRALWEGGSTELKYLGSRSVRLPVPTMLNSVSPVTAHTNLPLFFQPPSPAQISALPVTLPGLQSGPTLPLAPYGFINPILTVVPDGLSRYNAGIIDFTQRFRRGFEMLGSYTYSRLRADSTGTPLDLTFGRQDTFSLYDRRHRGAITGLFPLLARFLLAATYVYESAARLPALSAGDAGLVGLGFVAPAAVNPSGISNLGSDVMPLRNSLGRVVAYQAIDPHARFVRAAPGMFARGVRNAIALSPVNNIDLAVVKRFSYRDRFAIEARAEAYNLLNHPQFTGGLPPLTSGVPTFLVPGNLNFADPSAFFSAHPRTLQLSLRASF